jgi:hypothetical protein
MSLQPAPAMPTVYALIPKIMNEVGAIGKSGKNTQQNYKFRSIDDMYNKLQPVLARNGVFFVPEIIESTEDSYANNKGTRFVRVKVRVKYHIYAADGSELISVVDGEGIDTSDKATNKAITAAFKYMLIQVFCIAVEDLPDADKDSHEPPPLPKPRLAAAPKPRPTKPAPPNPFEKPENAGDYIVQVAPFKDMKLRDCDLAKLESIVLQLIEAAKDPARAKKMNKAYQELMEYGGEYLESLDRQPFFDESEDFE